MATHVNAGASGEPARLSAAELHELADRLHQLHASGYGHAWTVDSGRALLAELARQRAELRQLRRVEAAARAYCNNKLTVSERFSALDALTAALADRPAVKEGPTR